ncbi:hypothetical protein ACWGCP_34075 [Streptomyces niveus]
MGRREKCAPSQSTPAKTVAVAFVLLRGLCAAADRASLTSGSVMHSRLCGSARPDVWVMPASSLCR